MDDGWICSLGAEFRSSDALNPILFNHITLIDISRTVGIFKNGRGCLQLLPSCMTAEGAQSGFQLTLKMRLLDWFLLYLPLNPQA